MSDVVLSKCMHHKSCSLIAITGKRPNKNTAVRFTPVVGVLFVRLFLNTGSLRKCASKLTELTEVAPLLRASHAVPLTDRRGCCAIASLVSEER